MHTVVDVPRAWGQPLASAQMKSQPEDFIVRESLDFDLDDQGEHWFLRIRKCDLNTHDVVERLQREFNCSSADVGFSGLKDKVALTDQWFSVRSPLTLAQTTIRTQRDDQSVNPGEFVVLDHRRHTRKLRRGAHNLNHFIITLRNVNGIDAACAQEKIEERLTTISRHGFVNYFGPQRFGVDQRNLHKAERYFANPKRKISRVQRGLLISAARSALFNQVCARRVVQSTWNVPMPGEPLVLDGTHSYFINEEHNENTLARCQSLDVHPSGPMWGHGQPVSMGECEHFENAVLGEFETYTTGLEKAGLKQQRRPLRARVNQLNWQWEKPDTLRLDFNLLKGAYATSFLSEIVLY